MSGQTAWIAPGSFEPARHFFEGALREAPHPALAELLSVPSERLPQFCASRVPGLDERTVAGLLAYRARQLVWAGVDLMPVETRGGERFSLVIEINSCPAGQKYLPMRGCSDPQGGYRRLVVDTFAPLLAAAPRCEGALAVLYGKNVIEASGYAAAMADHFGEPVALAPFADEPGAGVSRFEQGRLVVQVDGRDQPMRAALRYITQRPWNRLPARPATLIVNPLSACLAGGRNKSAAAIAYEAYNREAPPGLRLRLPQTVHDARRADVAALVGRFGGRAVVKVPYSNAGQGIYPITCTEDLRAFLGQPLEYERYVVQSLIGEKGRPGKSDCGEVFQTGLHEGGRHYAADLRVVVASTPAGLRPVTLFGRRARRPFDASTDQPWETYLTNLSVRRDSGSVDPDTGRVVLAGERGFAGLDWDERLLADAFLQACVALIAVDRFACRLAPDGLLRRDQLRAASDDAVLLAEIPAGEFAR